MEEITIPMSEYKELLEIKGKYEETLRRESKVVSKDFGIKREPVTDITPEVKITCL